MHARTSTACPRCQIGNLHRGQATFVTCLDDQLLSIPDVANWTCDICQYNEFDPEAIRGIELITGALIMSLDPPTQPARAISSDVRRSSKATA